LTETIKQLNPPTMTDVLENWKRDTQLSINCIQIGIIQAFDSARQTATIQLAIKQVKEIKPDGTRVLVEYPLLLQCPVVTLFGGVDFMSMPVTVGDNCIVFFNDREIDNWFTDGGVQAPTSGRAHDLSDAIALVGVRSLQNSIATYLANGIRLSHGTGDDRTRIDLTDALISSVATLWEHTGDLTVTGTLKAGNGATGTFSSVTVEDGIVTGGS
jgi:hypothetical protein